MTKKINFQVARILITSTVMFVVSVVVLTPLAAL